MFEGGQDDCFMTLESTTSNQSDVDANVVRRRDFLNIAAVSFAGVGGVVALAPLFVQMAPSADVLALSTTEIDIS
jgi:ubiquinol-cytochrome c reductase iron-sulfur subunit